MCESSLGLERGFFSCSDCAWLEQFQIHCNPGLTSCAVVHNSTHNRWCMPHCTAEGQTGDALALQPEITLPSTLVLLQNKAVELVSENTSFWRRSRGWAWSGCLTFMHFASVCESSRFFLLKGVGKQWFISYQNRCSREVGWKPACSYLSSRELQELLPH